MLISLTDLAGSSHEKQLGCGIQTCVFRGTNSSNVFYFHISDYEPNLHSIGLPLKRLNLKTSWSWTSRAHCGSVICRDKFHRTRARFTRYFETTKLENQLKLGHLIVDRWLAETSFTVHAFDSLDTFYPFVHWRLCERVKILLRPLFSIDCRSCQAFCVVSQTHLFNIPRKSEHAHVHFSQVYRSVLFWGCGM